MTGKVIVSESLDIADWSKEEQKDVYDELVKLGIGGECPSLEDMTNGELSAHFKAVTVEMESRDAAVNTPMMRTEFMDDTTYREDI